MSTPPSETVMSEVYLYVGVKFFGSTGFYQNQGELWAFVLNIFKYSGIIKEVIIHDRRFSVQKAQEVFRE